MSLRGCSKPQRRMLCSVVCPKSQQSQHMFFANSIQPPLLLSVFPAVSQCRTAFFFFFFKRNSSMFDVASLLCDFLEIMKDDG
jgi:hypothetical protein